MILKLILITLLLTQTLFSNEHFTTSSKSAEQLTKELQSKYPSAKIKLVDHTTKEVIKEIAPQSEYCGKKSVVPTKKARVRPVVRGNVHIPNVGSNDELVILIVVIAGIFVVSAMIFYGGKFLYDLLVGNKDDYSYWLELSPQLSTFYERDQHSGIMNSIRLGTGFQEQKVRFGLMSELGHANLLIQEQGHSKPYTFEYILLGPIVKMMHTLRCDANYTFFEMLGGKSSNSELAYMMHSRIGVNIKMVDNLRFGVNLGGLLFGLHETESLFQNRNRLSVTLGIELGYQF
jgi:hypothetical protein